MSHAASRFVVLYSSVIARGEAVIESTLKLLASRVEEQYENPFEKVLESARKIGAEGSGKAPASISDYSR